MEQKELQWHLRKIGKFSASRADDLLSASGKWTAGNINYLLEIHYQRETQEPEPPINAWQLSFGIENEPYAIEWMRVNFPAGNILHCDADFTEKIFEEPYEDLSFGASPDAFFVDGFEQKSNIVYNDEFKKHIRALIEIKCVAGRAETLKYFSTLIPYSKKRDDAKKEHGGQMAAQLFAYPDVDNIYLLKYLPQSDNNEFDLRGVLDPTRGIVFEFTREELSREIDKYSQRVRFADRILKSKEGLSLLSEEK